MNQNITAIFQTMMETQANLNTIMGGDGWLQATLEYDNGFSYRRAIKVELSEAIGHTSYKWWVKKQTEFQQFKMELIDIAHFLLSFTHVVERSAATHHWAMTTRPYTVYDAMVEAWQNAEKRYPIVPSFDAEECVMQAIRHLETLDTNLYGRHTATQVTYTSYDLGGAWEALFNAIRVVFSGYTLENLLNDYLSKSLLNRFRTVNGAKAHGVVFTMEEHKANPQSYLKVWIDGREDVEHLSTLIAARTANGTLNSAALYDDLEHNYKSQFEA